MVEAGTTCSEPVTSVDYFPTICEIAGLKQPGDREIDGESILPLLTQKGSLVRDAIYWHFPHYRGKIEPYSIIRSGDWKLIKRYDGKAFELFNLREDISEKDDLSEKLPAKVKELDAKLVAWLRSQSAKMPKANPEYRGI